MTLIEQIKADRGAGTAGPWVIDDGYITTIKYFIAVCSVSGGVPADKRRIARVPDMEEALLAADELAKAVDHERNMPCQDIDMQLRAIASVNDALAAYRKATGTE